MLKCHFSTQGITAAQLRQVKLQRSAKSNLAASAIIWADRVVSYIGLFDFYHLKNADSCTIVRYKI